MSTIALNAEKAYRFVTGLAFLVLIGAVLVQVIGRLIGDSPVWTEEPTRFALLYLAAFRVGLSYRNGDLVNVDIVCENLPGRWPRVLRFVTAVATASMCAVPTLDPGSDILSDALMDFSDGEGASLVVDCAGTPHIFPQTIDLAASAGRIGLLSFSAEPVPVRQQDLVKKELSLFASRLNRGLIPEVLDWFRTGRFDAESLISHEFPYWDAVKAFEVAGGNPEEAVKVHLLFDHTVRRGP